ncbi:MAG TPA: hypothetical protein VMZ22_09720 [Acidimicrobiales bacterium]|nr:hypothetical protein [Acidimicrobiales bacterium]
MSSLWTPGGEKPVEAPVEELTEDEVAQRMEALREQLAHTPVGEIVAQSAYQFFEIGALHLSLVPPQLEQAKIAIDALGLLVEGLGGALGPNAATLTEGLTQIRMAFVAVSKDASEEE